MRMNAQASTAIEPSLAAPARTAVVLGVTDGAIYLAVQVSAERERQVLAVMTSDAVRLPCALVLGFSSAQRSLTQIGPRPSHPAVVGNGSVQWASGVEPVVIHATRRWAPPTVPLAGAGWPRGLAVLREQIAHLDIGIPLASLDSTKTDHALALLGCGPGLTPSGDDVLAGLLLGGRAFGTPVDGLVKSVAALADSRTTALSAQLLWHAIRGECVPEVSALIAALPDAGAVDAAIDGLLQVGHTSGVGLAGGLVMAAQPYLGTQRQQLCQ